MDQAAARALNPEPRGVAVINSLRGELDELPNSAESERLVLGACIHKSAVERSLDFARDAVDRLVPFEFYVPSHRRIFEAIAAMLKAGSEITPVLIAEEIKKDHTLESVGGVPFINGLMADCHPCPSNLDHYIANIKDSAARRQYIKISLASVDRAKDFSTPLGDSAEWTTREITRLDVQSVAPIGLTWGELAMLKLPPSDPILYGLPRGQLGMINAIPDAGKSTLIRNLAIALAIGKPFANLATLSTKRRVVLIDFETPKQTLQTDIGQMVAGLADHERTAAAENLFFMCDECINEEPLSLSTPDHMRRVVRTALGFRADLIIVDTISAAFNIEDENSNAEVNREILKPLRRLASETNTAVMGLHHMGKGSGDESKGHGHAVYAARGASAFGGASGLVINITVDRNDPQRIQLSMPKAKAWKLPPWNLQLNLDTRWFAITDQPVLAPRTVGDLIKELLGDHKARKRAEIETALDGQAAKSTITKYLKGLIESGAIEKSNGFYHLPDEMLPML
jgi:replicative DNA helicase